MRPLLSVLILGVLSLSRVAHATQPDCGKPFSSKSHAGEFATLLIQQRFKEAPTGSKAARWLSTSIFAQKLAKDCQSSDCTMDELQLQVDNAFPMIQQLSVKFDLALKGVPIPIAVSLITYALSNYAPLVSSNPVYIGVAAIVGLWPFKPVFMMLSGLADQSSFRNHAQNQVVSIASRDGAALETLQGQTQATYTMNSMMSRNGIAQFLIDFSAGLERTKSITREWAFKQSHLAMQPTQWAHDLDRSEFLDLLSDEYSTLLIGAYSLFREMHPSQDDHRFLRIRAELNQKTLTEHLAPEIIDQIAEMTLAKVLSRYANERSELTPLENHTRTWISALIK